MRDLSLVLVWLTVKAYFAKHSVCSIQPLMCTRTSKGELQQYHSRLFMHLGAVCTKQKQKYTCPGAGAAGTGGEVPAVLIETNNGCGLPSAPVPRSTTGERSARLGARSAANRSSVFCWLCTQVLVPAAVFIGLHSGDGCGCCGHESCGKGCAVSAPPRPGAGGCCVRSSCLCLLCRCSPRFWQPSWGSLALDTV